MRASRSAALVAALVPAVVAVVIGVRMLAARSNTQVHRINQK